MNWPIHLSAGCLFGLLFLASGQPAGAQTPRTFTTHLEGQVIDRPQSKKLLLCKDDENVWLTQPTEIPIRNGKIVIGIAREMGQLDDLKSAVEKDGYPWTQLYELDDAHGVWKSYGAAGAGAIFLIDKDGRIIAQDPTAEEIHAYLEKEL